MMISKKLTAGLAALALVAGLSACGGDEPAAPDVVVPQHLVDAVTARQSNFKDMGAAFKAISDEMKAGNADSATVEFSIKALRQYANSIDTWFPEGSGPESGLKMEAKAEIWSDPDGFAEEIAGLRAAIDGLSEATGDVEAIPLKFRAAGMSCKSCHDKFREED